MAFSGTTFEKASFKLLQGKAHTANNKDPANESQPSAPVIAAQEIFADTIPTDPDEAVANGIAAYISLVLVEDSSSAGKAYFAYIDGAVAGTSLDGYVNPRTGVTYADNDRVGFLIPPKFDAPPDPTPPSKSYRAILKDNGVEVPPLSSENWFIDYRAGVIVSESNLSLGNNGTVDGYVYIGNFVAGNLGKSSSGVSGLVQLSDGLGGFSSNSNFGYDGANFDIGLGRFDASGLRIQKDGTENAPSLRFGSTVDDDTGIWHPASNQLGFSTAGVERLRINTGLRLPQPGQSIAFTGTNGGGSEGIIYSDTTGQDRFALFFPGSDIVSLANRAANGQVQIRANGIAGAAGEVVVANFANELATINTPLAFKETSSPLSIDGYGQLYASVNDNKLHFVSSDGYSYNLTATGSGDVAGPVSSVDNAIIRFDGESGKVIQSSKVTIDDDGVVSVDTTEDFGITSLRLTNVSSAPTSYVGLLLENGFANTSITAYNHLYEEGKDRSELAGRTYISSWRLGLGYGSLLDGGINFYFLGNRNTNIAAIFAHTGFKFNVQNSDIDFTVAGSGDGYLLQVDAGSDNVGIGISEPTEKLQVDGYIHSVQGGFKFPDGSVQQTANTPVESALPITGNGSAENPLSIAKADALTDGYISSSDYSDFASKSKVEPSVAFIETCAPSTHVAEQGYVVFVQFSDIEYDPGQCWDSGKVDWVAPANGTVIVDVSIAAVEGTAIANGAGTGSPNFRVGIEHQHVGGFYHFMGPISNYNSDFGWEDAATGGVGAIDDGGSALVIEDVTVATAHATIRVSQGDSIRTFVQNSNSGGAILFAGRADSEDSISTAIGGSGGSNVLFSSHSRCSINFIKD